MQTNVSAQWTVYADGACAPSNPGPSAWGAVVIDSFGAMKEHSGFLGHGTNQIAELSAAINGLSATPERASVELVCDSQYVLKGLTDWRRGWEARGFTNAKKEPVAHQDLWKKLYAIADLRLVTTRWVKGHSGDCNNELADRLATAALREAKVKRAEVLEAGIPPDVPSYLIEGLAALQHAWSATKQGGNPFLGEMPSYTGVAFSIEKLDSSRVLLQWKDISINYVFQNPNNSVLNREVSRGEVRLLLTDCFPEIALQLMPLTSSTES